MERSRPIPAGGICPGDLTALVARNGPFATAWVGLSGTGRYSDDVDAAHRREVDRMLAESGAPEALRETLGAALANVEPGHAGVVAVATGDGLALLEPLPDAPRQTLARYGALPSISAVLEHRQADIPAIIVLADRIGADIVAVTPNAPERVVEVEGADDPIRKSAPGGWSQRRYQQRVENTWDRNAADVADRVEALAHGLHPAIVVAGGDERAVDLIIDRLPEDLRSITRTVTSGRAADGSAERRDDDIGVLLHTAVAEETVELLRHFEQELGQPGRAVNGAAATLSALQRSQVDVLLVHDDPLDDRQAWFGDAAGAVAVDSEPLRASGETHVEHARLVDAAVYGALRTGASVRVVPNAAALDHGVGAILRWPTEPEGAASPR